MSSLALTKASKGGDQEEIKGTEAKRGVRRDVRREDKRGKRESRALSAFTHPSVDEITLLCLAMSAVSAIRLG